MVNLGIFGMCQGGSNQWIGASVDAGKPEKTADES